MVNFLNHALKLFVAVLLVDVVDFVGHGFVKGQSSGGRFNQVALLEFAFLEGILWSGNFYLSLPFDVSALGGHANFVGGRKALAFSLGAGLYGSHIVDSQNHVLGRIDDCSAVGRVKQVAGAEHQSPALHLRGLRKRNVNGHLVAVKVSVEGFAGERVKLERLSFDQNRLEGLDSQAVQGRGAVEHYGVLADDFVQNGEDFRRFRLYVKLGLLKVKGDTLVHQLFHDEGLEQFKRHLCRKSALPKLELRADDDYRAS